MAKLIKYLAIALILAFTLVPAGVHISRVISGQVDNNSGENRALTGWPKWEQAGGNVAKYTGLISSHFNDQFGGRVLAIRARNKLFNLVGDGTASVLKGRTPGWYFYNSPYMEQSYRGVMPYNQSDTDKWVQSLERLQSAATENGAVFAAMIPPDKARIYPEHTPLKFGAPADRHFASDVVKAAQEQGIAMIDINPVLLARKANEPMFYQTDTHWTLRGGYEAYLAAMEMFEAQGADFPVINRNEIKSITRDVYSGDLAIMMGLKGEITEAINDFIPPEPRQAFEKQIMTDPSVSRAIWQTEIYNNKAPDPKTLVIIGDSFSRQTLPYFQHSFDKIVFMHHRRGAFDLDDVLSQNPDAVFFVPVEREAVRLRAFAD